MTPTPLEDAHDLPAREALPSDQAISREEEAILWRSLERIPEIYREPLILFYREHQSIESVAAALELSEDAVKQRLSRGRKLLQEEVQAFVENTLRRTAPGEAFSGAVLAAYAGDSGLGGNSRRGRGSERRGGGKVRFSGSVAGAVGSLYRNFCRHHGKLADGSGSSNRARTPVQKDCIHRFLGFRADLVRGRPICDADFGAALEVG